ncbi:MAG: HD domain-containing protein [Cyanobacteriota bacterium]|nr:HD domain-containing protein [Cyanobacteriota bacterium]
MWQEDYIRAYRFAARSHLGQTFPGTNLPDLMHLSFVSMEVIAALQAESQTDNESLAIQSALLHDVLEDTPTDFQTLVNTFGRAVAEGVLALSKDKELPKSEQMADSLKRIRQQPREIWMVKMADRLSNLQAPPSYWHQEKIQQYQAEAEMILAILKEASPYLAKRLRHKIEEYGSFIV